jgi:5-(carboxyamino)imidazole ribonucleotide synthase
VTVGVLGGGQLGRMLALAGYRLGLRFRFLDASADAPAGQVAPLIVAAFDDAEPLGRFAEGLAVATYEFENVPAAAARAVAARVPLHPTPDALEIAQDRLAEKTFFRRLEIPTPAFAPVDSREGLLRGLEAVGLPAVLKTRRGGYDGKAQALLKTAGEAEAAWHALGGGPLVLEQWVPFERELSVLAVRGRDGALAFYPLVENAHREGILRTSRAPAPRLTRELQAQGEALATRVLEALGYVGILAIELFEVRGQLLASEMAPRVHNSGHWTIDGAETSQFENHLRAVLGLPLGATGAVGHSLMLNLIGSTPGPERVLGVAGVHLHLYGKAPRPGRKLGHVTIRADEPAACDAAAARLGALPGLG